jgi:hypothetical protein
VKVIVTTTINEPTEALERFAAMDDWDMVVIGDQKTPHASYNRNDMIYLSPDDQESKYKVLSDLIGWNCIMRRNIGFIEAYNMGADIIATVDDDNIPNDNWGKNIFVGQNIEVNCYTPKNGICLDPVHISGYPHLWHRGFPLHLLSERDIESIIKMPVKVDFQADFWDGDPDIDAICRMIWHPNCKFDSKIFPFSSIGFFSPFNSQNTFIRREALIDYFMFPHVGRADDIWGSYYAESKGHNIIYGPPTVVQKRFGHNLSKDLENEVLMYTKTLPLLESLKQNSESIQDFVPTRSYEALKEYQRLFKETSTEKDNA